MKEKTKILVTICDECGRPWTDAPKEERCWCDGSPSSHEELRDFED